MTVDRIDDDGSLDPWLAALAARGALPYQALPVREQACRGRNFLMVVTMGTSPAFAWANALSPQGADAQEVRSLVATTSDGRIIDELRAEDVELEALVAYD
jgi:hypothetical protein